MADKMDVVKSEPNKEGYSLKSSQSARRKLIKSSPLLLILGNRPSFAASCSISGFMSVKVGTSLTTHDGSLCNGWSPGNWKNDRGQITQTAWAQAGVASSASFSSLFNTGAANIRKVTNGVVGDYVSYSSGISFSMLQVMEGAVSGGNDAGNIVKHAAATYLNAAFWRMAAVVQIQTLGCIITSQLKMWLVCIYFMN